RRDARVAVMEKTNARELTAAKFPSGFAPADLIVIDCSFISLRKIVPPAVALLRPSGNILALIKPQFEAGKAEADLGAGVIRDPAIHDRVIRELKEFISTLPPLRWRGLTESPIKGPAGNKEFLVLIENVADKIKRVGLIGNSDKGSYASVVSQAAQLITAAGRKLYSDPVTAQHARLKTLICADARALTKQVDLLLVFGG